MHIDAIGMCILDIIGTESESIPLNFPQAAQIPQFQWRSLSLHAIEELRYDVTHHLLHNGCILCLRSAGTNDMWVHVPLQMLGKSDYIQVRLCKPTTSGTPPDANGLTHQAVAWIDLAKTFTDTALYMFLHVRLGCPCENIMDHVQKANTLSKRIK